jgi:hypothetical protein
MLFRSLALPAVGTFIALMFACQPPRATWRSTVVAGPFAVTPDTEALHVQLEWTESHLSDGQLVAIFVRLEAYDQEGQLVLLDVVRSDELEANDLKRPAVSSTVSWEGPIDLTVSCVDRACLATSDLTLVPPEGVEELGLTSEVRFDVHTFTKSMQAAARVHLDPNARITVVALDEGS